MKAQTIVRLLFCMMVAFLFETCSPPAYKPMDIAAYNQKTKQWKFDYNLWPLNPNWQYKLLNGNAPWTKNQCPLSDNPADWKSSRTCTSQMLHFNNGQIFCTDLFSGHGGHMNWFPVTEVGIVNFEDHSSDDDYNFYLQTPDSSLYLASDDPDQMNQFLGLEFDSDEFPDPVDEDYNIWWNKFHDAVSPPWFDNPSQTPQEMVSNKLTIVNGMAGIDIGHDAANTWTTELHPVFGMFILTDEQTAVNSDGTLSMNDTWSFFIRNKGDEGYCSSDPETAGRKQINVLLPEMPYYYAGSQRTYQADARDYVTIDDGNVHITNWNGITDDNDPRREKWTKQPINGAVILNFNFDSDNSDGIFVGDIKLNWNIHISFGGFGNLRQADKFVDESKFREKFNWMFRPKKERKIEFESKEDAVLFARIAKLNNQEKAELSQALVGKTTIPGLPKLEPIPRGKTTLIKAQEAGKDSINIQQFKADLNRMKIGSVPKNINHLTTMESSRHNQYAQRKLAKRSFIDAYLKSKHL